MLAVRTKALSSKQCHTTAASPEAMTGDVSAMTLGIAEIILTKSLATQTAIWALCAIQMHCAAQCNTGIE